MYHLIYISHAVHPFTQAELEQLLTSARRNNKRLEVTGMLLYLNEKFIQVLEGERHAVEQVMNIIELDPRHKKLSVLLEGESPERIFKTWTMGFKRLGNHEFKELSGYEKMDQFFDQVNITDDSNPLLIFLRLFYQKNLNDLPELVQR